MRYRVLVPTTALIAALGRVTATPLASRLNPSVQLDDGVFEGLSSGSSNQFLGIPFALPPYVVYRVVVDSPHLFPRVGDLRLRLPQPNLPYNGSYNATSFGLSCIQQNGTLQVPPNLAPETLEVIVNSLSGSIINKDDEDCRLS